MEDCTLSYPDALKLSMGIGNLSQLRNHSTHFAAVGRPYGPNARQTGSAQHAQARAGHVQRGAGHVRTKGFGLVH